MKGGIRAWACIHYSGSRKEVGHRPYENGTHPRRSFLRGAAGALGMGFWADETLDALPQNTNPYSKPSDLKITDMRALTVRGAPDYKDRYQPGDSRGGYHSSGLGDFRRNSGDQEDRRRGGSAGRADGDAPDVAAEIERGGEAGPSYSTDSALTISANWPRSPTSRSSPTLPRCRSGRGRSRRIDQPGLCQDGRPDQGFQCGLDGQIDAATEQGSELTHQWPKRRRVLAAHGAENRLAGGYRCLAAFRRALPIRPRIAHCHCGAGRYRRSRTPGNSIPAARVRESMPGRSGAPGEIRTPDLLIRSQPLYPTELRAHATFDFSRKRFRKLPQSDAPSRSRLGLESRPRLSWAFGRRVRLDAPTTAGTSRCFTASYGRGSENGARTRAWQAQACPTTAFSSS